MKRNLFTVVLLLTALWSQAQNYVFDRKYNNYTTQAPAANFNTPYALTTASNGNFIVADYGSNFIYIISSTGILISEFGGTGSADGQFSNPSGVALDASGNIYVADRGNHRIQKFSSTGVFITKWGSPGSGNGQFNSPSDITINGTNVYVTDLLNHRVQYFNLSGTYAGQFGSSGTGNGQFNNPSGIATDASGNVYVSDRLNHRIQKFNFSGTYSMQWGTSGTADGQFNNPLHLKSDGSNIYVADLNNNRVQKFNTSGTFLLKWGTLGTGDDNFTNPKAITFSSGNIVVLDSYFFRTFTNAGVYVSKFTSRKDANGQFNSPQDITLDPSGNLYVLDLGNVRTQKIASNGDYISKYNFSSSYGVSCIAMDDNGTSIYHVRRNDHEVYRSGAPGSPFGATILSGPGTANGQVSLPKAMCVESSGNWYVLEEGNRRVQKFNNSDSYVTKWGSTGTGDGQFMNPVSIAADNLGNIFVAETNRIQKFTNTGTFILKWGTSGTGNGQFAGIKDISTDVHGNVYVVDGANRVQKFDGNGNFITRFGTAGTGDGQLVNPTGVYVDASGKVYVVDAGNNNVQTFVTDKEIKLTQALTEMISGTSVYDFGSVNLSASSADITFTISNLGSLNLTLTGSTKVLLTGANTADFSVNQSSITTVLAEGATTTFTVKFTPTALGTRTATLIISNDDSDENPFIINLTGNGKTNQTISSGGNVDKIYGDAPFTPASSASSGLSVSYSSGNTSVATVSGNQITIVGAGTAVITVSQSGNSLYHAAPDETFTLTVGKKDLTVIADDQSRYTGEANPVFTYTYSGFVNGDDASDLTGTPVLSCSASTGSPAGNYDIVPATGTLASDNYNFIFQTGTLSVTVVSSVWESEYADLITLYPNPSNGRFMIEAPDPIEQVTIIDAMGRREVYLQQKIVHTTFTGIVMIEVKTNRGTAYIKALVQ